MTIERANEIVDGIAAVLTSPQPVEGTQFTPLSKTRASTRLELSQAMQIVTAEIFKATHRQSEAFAEFVRNADSSLAHVLYLAPCLPDSELSLIATLPKLPQTAKRTGRIRTMEAHRCRDGAPKGAFINERVECRND